MAQRAQMVEWYLAPAAGGAPSEGIVLTGSGSKSSMRQFAARLGGGDLPVSRILEWDSFCVSILDPNDSQWGEGGEICFVVLRFEDWDHFSDHLANPAIEPSYGLVRKKTNELIECLTIAAARTTCRFALFIEWSEAAFHCAHVNGFFEEMTSIIRDSLNGYDRIAVLHRGSACRSGNGLTTNPIGLNG